MLLVVINLQTLELSIIIAEAFLNQGRQIKVIRQMTIL